MTDEEIVDLPIDGILDLHAFSPKDVRDLVPEYIGECAKRGITEVRIIHGKGSGILKAAVHALLKKDPRVLSFADADAGGGSWGATVVRLRPAASEPE